MTPQWQIDHRAWLEQNVKGKSFVDVGGLWGPYWGAVEAYDAGASRVTMIDVNDATPEYIEAIGDRTIDFKRGDIHDPRVLKAIGQRDVVLCSGVIYHCPNPLHTLECLRKITKGHLVLTCSAMLEESVNPPNATIFLPGLTSEQRHQLVKDNPSVVGPGGALLDYEPDLGYWNWFFAFTPWSLKNMLTASGFSVQEMREYSGLTLFVAT